MDRQIVSFEEARELLRTTPLRGIYATFADYNVTRHVEVAYESHNAHSMRMRSIVTGRIFEVVASTLSAIVFDGAQVTFVVENSSK
jgi:hypothetical protein